MKNFIERYKIKNLVKKFEETKAKRQQWEVKYNLMKIEELEDKLENADCHASPNDGCEHCVTLWDIKDQVINQELNYLRGK